MAEIVSIDLNTRTAVTVQGQTYRGDYMVLAAGSQANFFDTPGADKNSYPLYSLHDAELLRSRIIAVLEFADRDPSLIAKGALNFVIVGGGPTGAEMAGTLGDLLHRALKDEYPNLPLSEARIFLIDLGPAVLSTFSPKAQAYATKMLEERGVEIRLNTAVKAVGSGHVVLADGSKDFHSHGHLGRRSWSVASVKQYRCQPGSGRINVQPDLTVQGFPGYMLWETSPTSPVTTARHYRSSRRSPSSRVSGARKISRLISPANQESPSTILTKASWQ